MHLDVGRPGRRRPGAATPAGGTAPRRPAPRPAPAAARSRAPARPAASRWGSSGSGRSGRPAARRWRRRGRRAGTPRRRRWTAGMRAGRPRCSAPPRPASWCRPGRARSGRPAPARCRPASRTSSASCSWPGLAAGEEGARAPPGRRADAAGALQLGQPLGQPVPAGQRVQGRRGPARPAACDQASVRGSAGSSSHRYGSATSMPVQLLDQVEPLGRRVVGAARGGSARVGHGVRG